MFFIVSLSSFPFGSTSFCSPLCTLLSLTFLLSCALLLLFCPRPPIFHVDFQTGKSTDEKGNGVGWREPISLSLVKISRGSLERMLCVKEPAKWQNTVGGFIIIFSLLCMYNDCPHYKTQIDVHNYVTPDSIETGASIIHYCWCLFDNVLIFYISSSKMTDWLPNGVFSE